MSRFPVLDFDRDGHPELSVSRHVLLERVIEPTVDETDEFVTMPVRVIINSMSPAVEIGPYSLCETDIAALHQALTHFICNFPESFKRVPGGAS
ncbi:hypothetical protein FND50_25260 [Rhodococcus sp. WB9]|uniref:hypothetical protein n=1 Tax=Rhodococcus sp. WB9 TaxID=2594007 RepID=UPI00118593CD|nr:hypothetical protein [Rhodococcus sp. WB9]QDQ93740.1 hypothetical protein FND50_25260 [Rhodococcus sp. WB9]